MGVPARAAGSERVGLGRASLTPEREGSESMGLDTSHGCWHGPYSAFTRFRNELARAAGIDVQPVKHDSGFTHDTAQIDWDRIERENPGCYMGEWNTVEDEPLYYLLAHSDCEGVIRPEQAALLADRIEALLPALSDDIFTRPTGVRFIARLREAFKAGEVVDFTGQFPAVLPEGRQNENGTRVKIRS